MPISLWQILALGLTKLIGGETLYRDNAAAGEGTLNVMSEDADGEIVIVLQLSAEQLGQLPSELRGAIENLVTEFRNFGQTLPTARPLSVIASEIDQIAERVEADAPGGAELRADLVRRADELRFRDEVGGSVSLPGPRWPPKRGTCGVIDDPTMAVIGQTIIILPIADRPQQ